MGARRFLAWPEWWRFFGERATTAGLASYLNSTLSTWESSLRDGAKGVCARASVTVSCMLRAPCAEQGHSGPPSLALPPLTPTSTRTSPRFPYRRAQAAAAVRSGRGCLPPQRLHPPPHAALRHPRTAWSAHAAVSRGMLGEAGG